MTICETELKVLKALRDHDALVEQNAMTFKEIKEYVNEDIASGRLTDLRRKGMLKSSGGSLNKWWLTPLGVDVAIGQADTELVGATCPSSVGGDVDPIVAEHSEAFNEFDVKISHCKTLQLAAALEQATHEIIALKDELARVKSTQPESASYIGYLLGDTPNGNNHVQLYSESDKLIAYTDIEQAKKDGETACAESAYDFAVYALVPVGAFKSRVVVDWVGA